MTVLRVGVLDYGVGNIASIQNSLNYLDVDQLRVTEARHMRKCSHLILPGVGAFASGMSKFLASSLQEQLAHEVLTQGKPLLGICLGMQMFADFGYEFGVHSGLGLVPGKVVELDSRKFGLQLPHIGWSTVSLNANLKLLKDFNVNPEFYFLHSFHLKPIEMANTALCNYGEDFVAIIESNNVFGTQFHPEKSQKNGLLILRNFTTVS